MSARLAKHLKLASKALAKRDREQALDELIQAWRRCRSQSLEQLIDIVSAGLATVVEPLPTGADYDKAWFKLSARERSGDIDVLVGGLRESPKRSIPLRLRALLARGPDPRVGRALIAMIAAPPMTSSSMFSAWTKLFKELPNYADTRATKALKKRSAKHDGSSQFWPKLSAWINTAIPALPKPAELDEDLSSEIDELRAAAEVLRSEPPSTHQAAAARQSESKEATLATAATQLELERFSQTLESLRQCWGRTRTKAIAALIEQLGALLDKTEESLRVGKPASVHARWMKAGNKNPPAVALGRLLEALRTGKLGDVEQRLAAMTRWDPDPRILKMMFVLIEDHKVGARPVLWRLVFELVLKNADPRMEAQFAASCEAIERPSNRQRRQEIARALRRVQPEAREAFSKAVKLPKSERVTLAQLTKAVESLVRDRAEGGEDRALHNALLDEIVLNLDEDGPRLVFSDWLTERDDPMGEYIALSVALASGRRVKGKVTKLEKRHKAHLLGPLEPLIYSAEFERGFLKSAVVHVRASPTRSESDLDSALEDWRWSTVTNLRSFDGNGLARILSRSPLRSLRELNAPLEDLIHIAIPMPLESVQLRNSKAADWKKLDRVVERYLKQLRMVRFWQDPPLAEFFETKLANQVTTIVVGQHNSGGIPPIDEWVRRVVHAPAIETLKIQPANVQAQLRSVGRRRFELALTFTRSLREGRPDWETLLQVLRQIPKRAIARTTSSFDLPEVDPRRAQLLEALEHLAPQTVEFVPVERI